MNERKTEETKNEDIGYWLDRVRDDPGNLTSKLWWADAIRNDVIAANIKELYGTKSTRILDVPCGNAPICEFLAAEELKVEYTGVDIFSNSVLDVINRVKPLMSSERIFQFNRSSWKECNYEQESYDVVLCLDGPEHLVVMPDLHALDEIFWQFHEVLGISGTLFMSTPRARKDGDLHYPYCHDVEFSIKEVMTSAEKFFKLVYHAGYRIAPENINYLELSRPWQMEGLDEQDFVTMPHHIKAPFLVWKHPEVADSVLYVFKRI